jgi:hypothetical protein
MFKSKKNVLIVMSLLIFLSGCYLFPINSERNDLTYLIANEIVPNIIENVTSNSYMINKSFIIVKAKNDDVEHNIDDFTKETRGLIVGHLLKDHRVRIVRRQAVKFIFQPYKSLELPCENTREFEMLITIDIKEIEKKKASINIRAINMDTSNWMPGFSIQKVIKISKKEKVQLQNSKIDDTLRGLRFLPFEKNQADLLSTYLAQNLICQIINNANYKLKVYVDFDSSKKLNTHYGSLLSQFKRDLGLCEDLQITDSKNNADGTIKGSFFPITNNLYKIYIEFKQKNGKDFTSIAYTTNW